MTVNSSSVSDLLLNPSWDILAVFCVFTVVFFYGFSAGKNKLLSLLFSVYATALVFENFPYALKTLLIKTGVFLAVFIVMHLFLNKSIFKDTKAGPWWQTIILSTLFTGILAAVFLTNILAENFYTLSPLVEKLFAGKTAVFWWLISPLPFLFFVVKNRGEAKTKG